MSEEAERWLWTDYDGPNVLDEADVWHGFGESLTRADVLRDTADLERFAMVRVVPPTDEEARALAHRACYIVMDCDECSGADADMSELCGAWLQPAEWAPFAGMEDVIVAAVAPLIEPVIKRSLLRPVPESVEHHVREADEQLAASGFEIWPPRWPGGRQNAMPDERDIALTEKQAGMLRWVAAQGGTPGSLSWAGLGTGCARPWLRRC